MAFVKEYTCGCIQHELAGLIRRCEGMTSRSLSGRMTAKNEGAEKRHNDAMDSGKSVNEWTVGNMVR
jgi:hypothetical protein